jgi:hypothetical protein
MTTPVEAELRRRLRELATEPSPPNLADQALAGAKRVRRWRTVLAGCGVVLLAVIALPIVTDGRVGYSRLIPFGFPDSGSAACESATDESDPVTGVPTDGYPRFVRMVLAKMPPRDDYTLQSAYGVCPNSDAQPGTPGARPNGYAVVNLGPNREHGHLTINLRYLAGPALSEAVPTSCATLPTPPANVLFCDDSSVPMVFAVDPYEHYVIVNAVYPDGRSVYIEAIDAPITANQLVPVVSDPALADLLL